MLRASNGLIAQEGVVHCIYLRYDQKSDDFVFNLVVLKAAGYIIMVDSK